MTEQLIVLWSDGSIEITSPVSIGQIMDFADRLVKSAQGIILTPNSGVEPAITPETIADDNTG